MYSLSLQTHINITPARLLKIWRRPRILLREAKNIKNLTVTKRQKDKIFTAWEVAVDGVTLKWSQQDTLNVQQGVINFKMREGEFKKYQGSWQILPDSNGKTSLRVDVDIDWGIPVVEPYVKKTLQKKSQRLFRAFLASIKKVAESNER